MASVGWTNASQVDLDDPDDGSPFSTEGSRPTTFFRQKSLT